MSQGKNLKTAYFAGGCFWCITPIFMLYGAEKVVCGYSGGDEPAPTYEDVKHQKTGHRETIAVIYDEKEVSYDQLLTIYLANIDPFDGGGQYIDRGFSYTLAVYYNDEAERSKALAAIKALEADAAAAGQAKKASIAVESFKFFCEAEEYHQDYYLKNPEAFERELIESGRKKE